MQQREDAVGGDSEQRPDARIAAVVSGPVKAPVRAHRQTRVGTAAVGVREREQEGQPARGRDLENGALAVGAAVVSGPVEISVRRFHQRHRGTRAVGPVKQAQQRENPVGAQFEHRPVAAGIRVIGESAIECRSVKTAIGATHQRRMRTGAIGRVEVDHRRQSPRRVHPINRAVTIRPAGGSGAVKKTVPARHESRVGIRPRAVGRVAERVERFDGGGAGRRGGGEPETDGAGRHQEPLKSLRVEVSGQAAREE